MLVGVLFGVAEDGAVEDAQIGIGKVRFQPIRLNEGSRQRRHGPMVGHAAQGGKSGGAVDRGPTLTLHPLTANP